MPESKVYDLILSKGFYRELKKLSDVDKETVMEKLLILKENPSHPSFCTHKMWGKIRNFESYINMDIRIIWKFVDDNAILLIDVGHHDVLKKY